MVPANQELPPVGHEFRVSIEHFNRASWEIPIDKWARLIRGRFKNTHGLICGIVADKFKGTSWKCWEEPLTREYVVRRIA